MLAPSESFPSGMTCNLCGEDRPLVKSHIVPDSMNRVLRGVFGDDANSPILTIERSTGKTKRYPMGVYDKAILCGDCDGSFSPWEKHALEVLFTRNQPEEVHYLSEEQPHCYKLTGADYATLKLFVLSVAWRASISSNPVYAGVQLDRATNEALRTRLRAGDPGKASDFAVRIAQFHSVDIPLAAFEPRQETIDGVAYVVLFVPGYKILVRVGGAELPADHDFVMSPTAPVRVRLIDFRTSPERRAAEEIGRRIAATT